MGYITQKELTQFLLKQGKIMNTSMTSNTAILKHIIPHDKNSTEKKSMYEGLKYFKNENSILTRKITFMVDGQKIEDREASNNKLPHAFHRIITEQKAGYIVGNPIAISAKDTEDQKQVQFQEAVQNILGEKFNDTAPQWVKGSSNKGVEWLHVYVSEKGEFKYVIIPAEQVIPVFESQYLEKLLGVIRYYEVEKVINNQGKILIQVEWYDSNGVTYYIQVDRDDDNNEMDFVLDVEKKPNPEAYWVKFRPDGTSETLNWGGEVPFIPLPNNDEWMSDLKFYKELIDDYDLHSSDLSNSLADLQDAIWVLKNYEGTSLAEFRKNLKTFKAIKVDSEGNAESKTVEIPIEAKDKHMERLEEDIFTFGMSVNMKQDAMGQNPSGVALKFLYTLLDIKSNIAIRKMTLSLRKLIEFIAYYLKTNTKAEGAGEYDPKTLEFTFNKNIIINEQEKIQNLKNSVGMISEETIVSEHPYVKDPQKEIEKVRQERELTLPEFQTPVEEEDTTQAEE